MGWNKQSGQSWELQRTMQRYGDDPQAKALALKITGFMTIEDADALMRALHDEIVAARKSEGERFPKVEYTVVYQCRKCGQPIKGVQFRFGSPDTGWEHMAGECPPTFVQETLEAKEQMFGDAVLKNWDEVLGEEPKPSFLGKMSEPVGEEEGCTDCE